LKHFLVIIAAICSIFTAARVCAQTTTTESAAGTQATLQSNVFGVGLNASLCSGMGVAFREHFASIPLAYQITVGPWKTHSLSLFDAGLEIQYDLSLSTNRLYAVAGGGYYNASDSSIKNHVRFGAGIGYEVPFSNSIGAFANIMITVFEPSGDIIPLPTIGFLVYFR
jgi:hypothetical protein